MDFLWIAAIATAAATSFAPKSQGSSGAPQEIQPSPQGEVQAPVQDPPAVPPEVIPDPAESEPAEVEPAPLVYEPRYHNLGEVGAFVAEWMRSAGPDTVLVEGVELPATSTGLPVPALVFGAPGKSALADRPTVLLLGGLDGTSLAGSEAVLAACASLFALPANLPAEVAFLAVPWGSPEALAATLAGRGGRGCDRTPLDDDGDGAVDEDGPDDVDGDGKILDMLIEDPAGFWARAFDPRFLAPARSGDAPRYALSGEGRDDDQDGRFNEDPAGGVDFDRSFPVGWEPERALARGTLLPLEVPSCRALADLALSRRVVLVLLFQGDHGGLALPGSRAENPWPPTADAAAFEVAARIFARATGRIAAAPRPLVAVIGNERPGSALDWFYAVPGALALEVAVWGPSVEKPADAAGPTGVGLADALFENAARGSPSRNLAPPPSASDLAWGRWLDNTRGGIGFVDWHPVELGDGRQGLVGGWEPRSRQNPPEATLATSLTGIPEFVASMAGALPGLELRLAEIRREGEVCTIRARIANPGALPTGGFTSGRASGRASPRVNGGANGGVNGVLGRSATAAGVRLEIELPIGARLLAGDSEVGVGEIAGGGTSREVTWVVLAAPGTAITLRASAPWTASIAREVKP